MTCDIIKDHAHRRSQRSLSSTMMSLVSPMHSIGALQLTGMSKFTWFVIFLLFLSLCKLIIVQTTTYTPHCHWACLIAMSIPKMCIPLFVILVKGNYTVIALLSLVNNLDSSTIAPVPAPTVTFSLCVLSSTNNCPSPRAPSTSFPKRTEHNYMSNIT
jgi:hypothetical protein